MIRKQLYIADEQEERLKRRARELGISEAEFMRRALDAALRHGESPSHFSKLDPLIDEFLRTADEIVATSKPIRSGSWQRDDYYE